MRWFARKPDRVDAGGMGGAQQRSAEPGRVHHKGVAVDFNEFHLIQSRRSFFRGCAGGIGTIALADLLAKEGRGRHRAPKIRLRPSPRTFPAKAKNVIFLFMEGAPSQIDLFDPKPELTKWHGQPLPPSLTKDLKLAFIKPTAAVLASPRMFKPYGQCGMEILRLAAAPRRLRRRHLPGALHVHATRSIIILGNCCCSPVPCSPGGRRWARGLSTGWAASRRICPGFVVLSSGTGTSGGSREFFQRLSAVHLPGHDVPQHGRSDPVPVESRRHQRQHAAQPVWMPCAI